MSGREVTKESTDNHKNKFARSDIIERIIKNCGGVIKKCNDGEQKKEIKDKILELFQDFKEIVCMKAKNHHY